MIGSISISPFLTNNHGFKKFLMIKLISFLLIDFLREQRCMITNYNISISNPFQKEIKNMMVSILVLPYKEEVSKVLHILAHIRL